MPNPLSATSFYTLIENLKDHEEDLARGLWITGAFCGFQHFSEEYYRAVNAPFLKQPKTDKPPAKKSNKKKSVISESTSISSEQESSSSNEQEQIITSSSLKQDIEPQQTEINFDENT